MELDTLRFDIRSEAASDRLTVHADGRFDYESRRAGELPKSASGSLEAAAHAELAGWLEAAGFPNLPARPLPPGAGYVTITARGGAARRRVLLHPYEARRLRGYGVLLERIREWTAYLRGDAAASAPAGLRPLARR